MKIRTGHFAALVATLIAMAASPAFAEDRYEGVKLIRGTVFSVGRADPRGQAGVAQNLDTGIFIDANYSSVFINGGVGAKDFSGHRVVNAYAGIGFGRIIQLQLGYGDRGSVGRVRTDLNLRSVYNFLTQDTQPRREKTLADRVTFTYTIERYSEEKNKEFDNGTIGVGVLYDGPF